MSSRSSRYTSPRALRAAHGRAALERFGVALVPLRVLVVLALLLVSAVGRADLPAAAGSAAAPPQPAAAAGAVRRGTTQLHPPAVRGQGSSAQQGTNAAPADAPRLAGANVKVPPPPDAYNIHDAGWIRFAYPPSVRQKVQPLIADANGIRAELSARLGQPVLEQVSVHIARTPGEMATLAPEGAPYPKYAAGVAYSRVGLILLTIAPLYPNTHHDLGEIFRHELAHLALYDALGSAHVPRWFNEGFAVHASGEGSVARLKTLWTATLADTLIPLRQLHRSFPADPVVASVAYAEAADIARFLLRRQDSQRFVAMIQRIRRGQSFEHALSDAYGTDLAALEHEWREDVAKRYTFWPVLFSGGVIWFGIIGLFVWGWRRRRKRNRATLERWAREEAAAEARSKQLAVPLPDRRVHVILSRGAQSGPPQLRPRFPEPDVPKVEHKGEWHTLH
jgi:hypothetical protein